MTFDIRFFFTLSLVVVCGALAARSFAKLIRILRFARRERLLDGMETRIALVMRNVFGHGKLMKDPMPGIQHFIIFTGFITITAGTAESVIEGFFHGFSYEMILGGAIAHGLAWLQDWLHPLVAAAALYGFYRRLISKPKRLPTAGPQRRDALIVLSLTFGHVFANMVALAGFIATHNPHAYAPEFRPVSSFLASLLVASGMSFEAAQSLGYIGWALHMATVFGFLIYIPNSKHLHIIAAGPNIFFSRLKHRGTFQKVNFEDETQTTYGVGKLPEFSWKDILDAYSCTACGRCNEFCPTATTGKPLRPAKLMIDLRKHALTVADAFSKDPAAEPPQALISEASGITEDVLWGCTTCKACVEACPVMIEHVDKIVDMRRNLVLMQGSMPAELQNTMRNWETQSNPWGFAPDSRDEWAKDLGIARYSEKPTAEYLFYVGCAGSFNDRNKKISTAFVKILQTAGIDFAILGKEELCNGETARRGGNEYLAKAMIDANIEVLKRYSVKKVLTTCPHCFNTIKNEYPDFGFHAEEVVHHTEFIDRLVKDGRIKPKADATGKGEQKIAFHDSCYLGRYNEVYEAPRETLKSVPGVELVEMPRNRKTGLCCGAGGARMWMEETQGKRINVERAEEALATQPDVIAAGCPFCQVMLTDGVNEKGAQANVQVLDVAEIIAARL
jgi:Fe-S oxidoreductase